MSSDDDFQKQLELEALEKQKNEGKNIADPYLYTDPNDGTVYEWDSKRKAWFPKINDDFIASYQANYTYQDEGKSDELASSSSAEVTSLQQQQNKKGEKRKPNDPTWFEVDDEHNTNVYVSGLPSDTTEEEFVELMSKCGLIMKDPESMKYKIKLYRNEDGTIKGDGRCCYIKVESVKLALDIIDGYIFKGKKVSVERAQFQLKGTYDPTKKPKRKKKDKEKLKKKLDKLFDWRPDKLRGMRSRHENTVVIKNMFDPKEFDADASLLLDYQKDIREECSKCGEVKKVVIYDRNPEGVVAVTFSEPEMADECVNLMNGRWFAQRQLHAANWDGKTKYKIVETEEERAKRLKEWENFLLAGKKQEASVVVGTSQDGANCVSSDANQKDNQIVPQNAYELAGETDSSGESDNENDQEVSSSSNIFPSTTTHDESREFSPPISSTTESVPHTNGSQ